MAENQNIIQFSQRKCNIIFTNNKLQTSYENLSNSLTIFSGRIFFNIEQYITGRLGSACVRLYNLPTTQENQILSYTKTPSNTNTLIINAGHNGQTQNIFQGSVCYANTQKFGCDNITTVYAIDGYKEIINAHVNQSFLAGTPYSIVFKNILKRGNISTGYWPKKDNAQTLLRGTTFSGSFSSILTEHSKSIGANWNIQSGQMYMLPYSYALPRISYVSYSILSSIESCDRYLSFSTLLNNSFFVGGQVRFDQRFDGIYKILAINVIGDTHQAPWWCQVKSILI